MDRSKCWRCGQKNAEDDLICAGCGVEGPQQNPRDSREEVSPQGQQKQVTNIPTESLSQPKARITQSTSAIGRPPESPALGDLANRLVSSSQLATRYLMLVGVIASIAVVGLSSQILTVSDDSGAAFLPFVFATVLGLVVVWVSIGLLTPLYLYLTLRGNEYKSR
jgi:hypothetical protein